MSSTIFFVALVICVSNNLVMTNVNTNTNMPNINIPIASIEPMYHMKRNVAEHILVVHVGLGIMLEKDKHSRLFFQKLRTLSIGIFFTPSEWTTKKAKRNQHQE
jgi:hypothetical protein